MAAERSKRETIRSRDLDLLLVGKTGNGKSRTGNTILGFKAFDAAANATSVTKNIVSKVAEYGGRLIKVVDGPGVGDTSGTDQEANRFVMEQLSKAIAINDKGYHAFLLVVRFGIRFERNDKNAVDILKAIFGPDLIRKHCILLFTYGDNFEGEFEGENKTIQEWCQEQSGPLKELYEECGRRVILFDNLTKDARKRKAQVDGLIAMVDNLCISGVRYTNEHFATGRAARKRLQVQVKAALIDQKTMEEVSLILQKTNKINRIENLVERKGQLTQLLHIRWEPLYQELKKEDERTGVFNALLKTVKRHRQAVNSDIIKCSQMIDEEEELKKREHEIIKERRKQAREQKIREEQEKRNRERRVREQREMQAKQRDLRELEKKLERKKRRQEKEEQEKGSRRGIREKREMQEEQWNMRELEMELEPGLQKIVEEQQALAKQKTEWMRNVEEREEKMDAEYTVVEESIAESIFKTAVPAISAGIMASLAGAAAPVVAAVSTTVAVGTTVVREVANGCSTS